MHAKIAVAAAALMASTPLVAAGFADPASIDQAVAQFTGASIGTPGGARSPIDRRLRLAQCSAPFDLEWYGRTRDTVLVRCPEADGWRVFVPLTSGAAAGQTAAASNNAAAAVVRGEVVSIAVRGSGFTLTRQGEAMEGGAVGDWIRVRPVDRRSEPLRAQVLRPGLVGMQLP